MNPPTEYNDPPSPLRSRIMRAVKSQDTAPELAVRKLLRENGLTGYRLHRKDLPGKPDIAFIKRRKVIFVHGCFWHQHEGCPASARPSSNIQFWDEKLDKTVVRDAKSKARLEALGWHVLTVWECETKKAEELREKLLSFMSPLG